MTTTNTNQTTKTNVDQHLTFDDSVIEKIAGITATRVPGIISLDGNMFSEFADKVSSGNNMTKGINADVGENKLQLKWMPRLNTIKAHQKFLKQSVKKLIVLQIR